MTTGRMERRDANIRFSRDNSPSFRNRDLLPPTPRGGPT